MEIDYYVMEVHRFPTEDTSTETLWLHRDIAFTKQSSTWCRKKITAHKRRPHVTLENVYVRTRWLGLRWRKLVELDEKWLVTLRERKSCPHTHTHNSNKVCGSGSDSVEASWRHELWTRQGAQGPACDEGLPRRHSRRLAGSFAAADLSHRRARRSLHCGRSNTSCPTLLSTRCRKRSRSAQMQSTTLNSTVWHLGAGGGARPSRQQMWETPPPPPKRHLGHEKIILGNSKKKKGEKTSTLRWRRVYENTEKRAGRTRLSFLFTKQLVLFWLTGDARMKSKSSNTETQMQTDSSYEEIE